MIARSTTLHDVAREAGVSLMTVSRALRSPDVVSKATLENVRKAIASTGYIPNMLAGGLKSRRSMTVAGLMPIISVPQFLPTVRSLTDALDESGYQLILGQIGYDHAREEKLISAMIGRRPDGVVITGLLRSASSRKQLRSLGIPVVETWDLSTDPVDMAVGFSHENVGAAVARFFLSKGWGKLAIATGDDVRAQLRKKGFLSVCGDGILTETIPAPSSLAQGRAALSTLLKKDPDIRAIFCSSDGLAQGVIVEASSRKIRVPEDLAVCGFGEADFAAHYSPSLTTVHIDGGYIGRLAARLIVDRCNGAEISNKIIDLGFSIVERESTGFIPSSEPTNVSTT